jgi:hypothetical protein
MLSRYQLSFSEHICADLAEPCGFALIAAIIICAVTEQHAAQVAVTEEIDAIAPLRAASA